LISSIITVIFVLQQIHKVTPKDSFIFSWD